MLVPDLRFRRVANRHILPMESAKTAMNMLPMMRESRVVVETGALVGSLSMVIVSYVRLGGVLNGVAGKYG